MNSYLNTFYKPRLSKFNRFPIMCPNCTLRMHVDIAYDKENDCYNPKSIDCKICTKPIPINVFSAVAQK
jgi:hypothetical protein